MNVTKMSIRFGRFDRANPFAVASEVVPVLAAAMSPFGSLREGVGTTELAWWIVTYATAHDGVQLEAAMKILAAVCSTSCDKRTAVQFGACEVILITPTSGTRIRLTRITGGLLAELDFGPQGSEDRALTILRDAELAGVKFSCYAGEAEVPREEVTRALYRKVLGDVDYFHRIPSEDFSAAMAEGLETAEAEAEFFRTLR